MRVECPPRMSLSPADSALSTKPIDIPVFDVPYDATAFERAAKLDQEMCVRDLPIMTLVAGFQAYLSIAYDLEQHRVPFTPRPPASAFTWRVIEGQRDNDPVFPGCRGPVSLELDMLTFDPKSIRVTTSIGGLPLVLRAWKAFQRTGRAEIEW